MVKKTANAAAEEKKPEAYPLGAHGAMNKERHVCARRRAGEAAGSLVEDFFDPRTKLDVSFTILIRKRG